MRFGWTESRRLAENPARAIRGDEVVQAHAGVGGAGGGELDKFDHALGEHRSVKSAAELGGFAAGGATRLDGGGIEDSREVVGFWVGDACVARPSDVACRQDVP